MKSRSRKSVRGRGRRGARFSLVAILLIVGSGLAVYNADSLYLAGDMGLSVQVPTTLATGANNTILVLTTDASGEPAARRPYTIDVLFNGTSVAKVSGVTDSRGLAAPELYVPPTRGDVVLVVRSGDEKLTIEADTRSGSSVSRVFLTTDKPIYQPGQVVHARLLVLRQDLWATPMGDGALVTFEVVTPDGDKVYRKTAPLDAFGVVAFDYPLSDQLPLGDYELKAAVGGFEVVCDVKVDEYVLPRFDINFGDLRRWYTFDEDIDAYALVKYFFGERVVGSAALKINVYDGSEWKLASTFTSRPLVGGTYEFTYDLDRLLPDYWSSNYRYSRYYRSSSYQLPDLLMVELNLTVTDTGGHTETDTQLISVANNRVLITALSDVNVEGQRSTYHIIARYPDGTPVPDARIEWHLERWEDRSLKTMTPVMTDERGIATLAFTYDEDYGRLRVKVTKGTHSNTVDFNLRASRGIKAVSERPSYDVGDVAVFDVYHAGDPASDLLYYDVVADGFTIATGHVQMPDDRVEVRLPVTPDFGHLTSVRFYRIERNFVIARDVVTIGVAKDGGDLEVAITPDQERYMPQDDVELRIEVLRRGTPTPAMLGVSIVDNAVFELGARFTGFEEVVAGTGPFYTDPYYQVMGYVLAGDTALPSQGYREWRREGVDPVASTGYVHNARALAYKDDAVGAWWTLMACLAVVGLIAVLVMGQRMRQWKAVLAVIALSIAPAVAVWGAVSNLYREGPDEYLGQDTTWDPLAPPPPPRESAAALEAGGFGFDFPDIFGKDDDEPTGQGSSQGSTQPRGYGVPVKRGVVRQFFPETWAWVPVLPTDGSGVATLDLVAPDSITSWDVSVIASTQDSLVGVAHGNVTVFQEFFVEPDLPAKAFLGDSFPLKVQVYNYGPEANVTVSVAPGSWFAIDGESSSQVALASGEVGYVELNVTMLEVGVGELRVRGESATFTDTVVRPLRVKPAGEHVTDLFQDVLMEGDVPEHTFTLLPDMIPNSQNAWVKLQGGIEAVIIDGAECYVHKVTGCGEQSMSMLSIDVLAFVVARQSGVDGEDLARLEGIVNQGIQYELQFLYDDGSGRGIVYYPGQNEVNAWLTAWGLQTLSDAKEAGLYVDDDILFDMRKWLKAHQLEDGSFPFSGFRVQSSGGTDGRKLATTSYVTKALLLSGGDRYDPAIVRALDYVELGITRPEAWSDSYVLALGLMAIVAGGQGSGQTARSVADRLHELRAEEGNWTYWGSSMNLISYERFDGMPPRELRNRNPSFVVETTGYATQALYAMHSHLSDVQGALRFLVEGRNYRGGWGSTQDTIVAFQTVWQVSTLTPDVDMLVEVLVDGEVAFAQSFDESNSDMTYLYDLRPLLGPTTTVALRGTGEGSIMFQAFLEQWLPWGGAKPSPLEFAVSYANNSVPSGATLRATARLTNAQEQPIRMTLVELVAPVGVALKPNAFMELRQQGLVQHVEWVDGAVRLYIDDLDAGETLTFDYWLEAFMPAQVTLAGNRAFDMYNPLIITELEPVKLTFHNL